MNYQIISEIIQILGARGCRHAVISPGSRSAMITLALAAENKIKKYVINDERSAGYIAVGMAGVLQQPVLLVCTSGTAVYNLAPAIAESFYQHIPLLILSADRPPEWIDQGDGQTIHQDNIFGKHVKASYCLPAGPDTPDSNWYTNRMVNEAYNLSVSFPGGPVHLNIPIREPVYPPIGWTPDIHRLVIKQEEIGSQRYLTPGEWDELVSDWNNSKRILIVAGQMNRDELLTKEILLMAEKFKVPILADLLSNLSPDHPNVITHYDLFINQDPEVVSKTYQPDLLISLGNTVLSRNLKIFLRKYKPGIHWHIQPSGYTPDTFQLNMKVLRVYPLYFFYKSRNTFNPHPGQASYLDKWNRAESVSENEITSFFHGEPFSELEAVKMIMESLPSGIHLHLANSMPVRLANWIGLKKKEIHTFSNRGTSGIDGCMSSAVGATLVSTKTNILITGDIAFFYDRNALWNDYDYSHLKIFLLNNHGGGIFRIIDGPGNFPQLKNYFETNQFLRAENTAKDFNLAYFHAENSEDIRKQLDQFYSVQGKAALMEIETSSEINSLVFKQFKNKFRKLWN